VTMRDGMVLRADIYRPVEDGHFPVLLQRTPYDKRNGAAFGNRAAAAGYVVVIQDVRGRYTSEGEWYPFRSESQDGYDTVEWAAALPYSNGKVGMFGGSYVGATQMLTAIAHPPHLAGICPVVTASDYHNGWTYQGGAFEQWFNESWTSGLAQDTLNRRVQSATNAREGIWKLPLASYPLFNTSQRSLQLGSPEVLAPYFLDWLAHPNYDEYWKRWSIEEHYPDIRVPALHVAAWYDIFQGGSLRNYAGIKGHGGTEAARNGQHLLITIGGHAGGGRKIGDVDFGAAAEEFQEDTVTLEWYDYLFKGVKNQFSRKPVRITGAMKRNGRQRTLMKLDISCIRRRAQIPCEATARCPVNLLALNPPIITFTIPRTRSQRLGDLCAAIASTCQRDRATSVRTKLETMC
jgi:uncharacterized protein